jgi:hypothetical protein
MDGGEIGDSKVQEPYAVAHEARGSGTNSPCFADPWMDQCKWLQIGAVSPAILATSFPRYL